MVDPICLIILEELEGRRKRLRSLVYNKTVEVVGSFTPSIFPVNGKGVLKRLVVSSNNPFGLLLDVDCETVMGDFDRLVDLKDEYSNITAYIKNNRYYLIVENTEFCNGVNVMFDFPQKSKVKIDAVVFLDGG
jgi:hypothetical protein